MSVARARVVVELGDLRAALVSVRPHIAAEVDGIPPALQRMRVTITPDLVWCSATDRYLRGWRNRLPAPAPVELLTTFPTTPTDDDMPGGGDE